MRHFPSPDELRRSERASSGGKPNAGHPCPPAAEPKRLRLISWKPMRKGSLLGFAAVELSIGLRIHDIPIIASHGKSWVAQPSKPQVDKDGQHREDITGKPASTAIIEWRDGDLSNHFSDAVVALVRAAYPDVLIEEGGQ